MMISQNFLLSSKYCAFMYCLMAPLTYFRLQINAFTRKVFCGKPQTFICAQTCWQFLIRMLTNALTVISILHFTSKSTLWLFIITLPLDVTFSHDVVRRCCQHDGEISWNHDATLEKFDINVCEKSVYSFENDNFF